MILQCSEDIIAPEQVGEYVHRNLPGGTLTESLEDLYENAPCGYPPLKPDGRIVKVNLIFSKWIGYSAEELVGQRLHDLLNVAGQIFYETHFAPLLPMQGFFNEVALDLMTREGGRLPVLVNAAERRDSDGRHLFARLTIFNATDRRRYERELVAARAAAEAAQKELQALNLKVENELLAEQAVLLDERATAALREEFIAVLGHDLRNPLAAIEAGMRLLRATPLDHKAKLVVGMVQDSTARMAGLIENVMDFVRVRLGGGLSVDRSAAEPLEPVLRQVASELRIAMPGRVIEADFALTAPVHCDRRRIGQLASNLLGNALTHGAPDQPVRIGATTARRVVRADRRQCRQAHTRRVAATHLRAVLARHPPSQPAGAGALHLKRDRRRTAARSMSCPRKQRPASPSVCRCDPKTVIANQSH